MTTRAGWTGLLTGLIASLAAYLLYRPPDAGQGTLAWTAAGLILLIMVLGGWLAARRSGSRQRGRCAVLGALAGGAAGTLVFYLWGAAAAGLMVGKILSESELVQSLLVSTCTMFLVLFGGGSLCGALGGWLASLGRSPQPDSFDKKDPQMALNVTVTAVPACVFAAVVSAVLSSSLAGRIGKQFIADLPLELSLLLFLLSLLTLGFVLPHEARQAEHRCGMDEVKMLGAVGIGAAPVLALLLFLFYPKSFSNPLVIAILIIGLILSLKNMWFMRTLVIPRRAQLPAPWEEQTKQEAVLFGSISNSKAPRLIKLCVGCGLVMMLPLQACVISLMVNLNNVGTASNGALFLKQAALNVGISAAAVAVLILIYLLYLYLGRRYNRQVSAGK